MIIIVEGADKTGKTTLCKAIADYYDFEYKHFGPPGPDPALDYAKFLLEMDQPVVCDRFYVGELIYGPLLRGKALMSPMDLVTIERLIRLRGGIVIHADTPTDIMMQRFGKGEGEHVNHDQNLKAHHLFKAVIKQLNVTKMRYFATSKDSIDHALETMEPVVNDHLYWASEASEVCTGIGTVLGPKFILVGDEINPNATRFGLPFDRGSAATFLWDCLQSVKIDEQHVYVVNQKTLGQDEVDFLREGEAAFKFVALGQNAHERLKKLKVGHVMVHHPQFIKRFRLDEKEKYAIELGKAYAEFMLQVENDRRERR